MDEDRRFKLCVEQMRQQYERIGEFVVKFEHVNVLKINLNENYPKWINLFYQ